MDGVTGAGAPKADRPWFEFRAEAAPARAELRIYGPIGGGFFDDEDAASGKRIANELARLPKSITEIRVFVNSPGGNVFDGLQIANALRRESEVNGRTVVVEVEALAASAATLITSSADTTLLPANALMMIHNPWLIAMGDSNELRKSADTLDQVRSSILATYQFKSDLDADEIGALMDDETWMDANEAVANGFADEVIESVEAAAGFDPELLQAGAWQLPNDPKLRERVASLFSSTAPPASQPGPVAPEPRSEDHTMPDKPNTPEAPTAPAAAPTPAPAAPAPAVDAQAQAQATANERQRNVDIQTATATAIAAGMNADEARTAAAAAVVNGTTAADFRSAMLDRLAEQSAATGPDPNASAGSLELTADEADKRRVGITAALLQRAGQVDVIREAQAKRPNEPALQLELDPGEFRGMSLMDHARESLERAKHGSTRGLSKMELAGQFFMSSGGGQQTTSDFAVALENVLYKVLLANYAIQPDSWRTFCGIGSVNDFKPHPKYMRGYLSRLDKVGESGEFQNKPYADALRELQQAETFGNILALSRQALVNDDMGMFTDLAAKLGRAAGLSIEIDVYGLLAQNGGLGPNMSDGNPLFDAAHNNINTTASGITTGGIEADRVVMARQTDPNGNEFIDARPEVLLVSVEQGGEARVVNDAQYDTDTSGKYQKPNKVRGLFTTVTDTPRLSGTRRYLFVNPAIIRTIEVAFLEGQQNPVMEMTDGWRVDGVEWKVRHDYGVAAIDWRGAVTNAGA